MRLLVVFLLCLGSLLAQLPNDARNWLNQGVQAFRSARYAEAIVAFQKAVELSPGDVTPRLYLATAYMQQFIPGAESPENTATAERAAFEFRKVLDIDAGNVVAMQSLASLALNRKQWDEATNWYRRVINVSPGDKTAYYSLAFITWARWYPAITEARTRFGMRPETPGPIADPAVRTALRAQWWSALDEAVFNLNRALELDPQYDDAMAYLNLILRERADLRDTAEEYRQDVAAADQWVRKALETKRAKAGMVQQPMGMMAPPPPPPPPPPAQPRGQAPELVRKVIAVYPPLAVEARVQGTVRFQAVINKDGTLKNLQVISGHPLLIPAAIDAVKQWVYQPTLLNGEPVEVITQIDVPFALPN